MTNPTPLSPAAQAVVTALEKFDWESGYFTREDIWALSKETVAAALRVAADQNNKLEVPFAVVDDWERIKGSCASFYAAAEWGHRQALKNYKDIAAELEGANNASEND